MAAPKLIAVYTPTATLSASLLTRNGTARVAVPQNTVRRKLSKHSDQIGRRPTVRRKKQP